MIKGKTKSGIKFQLNENIKDDARVLFYLTKLQTATEPMEQSKSLFGLLQLMFGSEENLTLFMNEVASKNKGICNAEVMIAEITEMFEALGLKNS